MGQVVKRYVKKRVVAVERRIVQGAQTQIAGLLERTQGGGHVNTAFIERLNATFRSRIAALVRRTRALARQTETLQHEELLSFRVPLPAWKPPKRRRRRSNLTKQLFAQWCS